MTNRKQAGQWKAEEQGIAGTRLRFELLIAPYVVSHLKLGLLYETVGHAPLELGTMTRLHVFLTNTLEEGRDPRRATAQAWGITSPRKPANAAHVKKQDQILWWCLATRRIPTYGGM
ncbi:MAG: hypothetical protein M0C28_33350 [Candidatus Moduliflexus flocculans]|nr:hypothetical protein [Candidatus Moduliflexus flocculans]